MLIDPEYEQKYESIVKDKLLELCRNKTCRIFLFGSRARGQVTRGSDFDIGITGLSKNEFENLTRKFQEFLDQSIVPYSVDLVNFDRVAPEFRKQAEKHIRIWKPD